MNSKSPVQFLFRVVELLVAAVVVCMLALVFVIRPFGSASHGFESVTGNEAQSRLGDAWPPGVQAADVSSVSMSGQSGIEGFSYWYRIELSPAAAAAWQDHIHWLEEEKIKRGAKEKETAEGVHRTVSGPISFRQQTGEEPRWWNPPAGDFRATEGVRWSSDDVAAVGNAVYSLFDEASRTLWIYDYSSQHDRMWTKGDVPAGQPFSSEMPVSAAAAKARLGHRWPSGVDPKDVKSCEFEEGSARLEVDWPKTTTSWLKVALPQEAAAVWEDAIHDREAERIRELKKLNKLVEGVQRTTNGRLPVRLEVSGRPEFWAPPQASYRTTEAMNWGVGDAVPTGMALYSWFDADAGVLWVYQNSAPRDVLWAQGKLPAGKEIAIAE